MAFLVGIILALAVGLSASFIGFDRDRAFYPTVMIVIASYYALFASMGSSGDVLALEVVAMAAFIIASIVGFKTSLWLLVLALVGHGVFDALHSRLFSNPGVPTWWPRFCLAYDVVAGMYLACMLKIKRIHAR